MIFETYSDQRQLLRLHRWHLAFTANDLERLHRDALAGACVARWVVHVDDACQRAAAISALESTLGTAAEA
ncbi:MAG: hypothetical protein L6Q84_24430 [Polyangiaceae bacterium]|nr:hypothetical protein [Polyangiaceae bacterium]